MSICGRKRPPYPAPHDPRPRRCGRDCGGERRKEGYLWLVLKPGDKVLWNRGVTCGHCYFCRVKREPSVCPYRWVYGIHTSCAEPPYLTGNYSEYLLLDRNVDLFKIESDVDLLTLVPASCSGATAAHAFDLSKMESGDSVLVQGVGPLGIFAIAFAKSFGASRSLRLEERRRGSPCANPLEPLLR